MKLSFTVATPDTRDEDMYALRGPLERSFARLAELGYQGAELMVRDPGALDPVAIRDLARAHGLAVPAISTGQLRKEDGLELCHLDAALRRRAVDRTCAVVAFAAAVGAPQICVGTLRGKLAGGAARSQALAAARDSFAEVLACAARYQVRVAVEPQCQLVINWLNSPSETLAWMREIAHPALSMLFDTYHVMLEEPSFFAALVRALPFVTHVQTSDSNRQSPGDGQLNFGEMMRTLRALGYGGFVSIEARPSPSAEAIAERAIRHLRRYFDGEG
jgi:sugar phosphate isomerase/epimerase